MKLEIKDLAFADCLLISFSIENDLSRLLLAFEAYLSGELLKKIFELDCVGILNIRCDIRPEIYEDQKIEYKLDGFDQRANEIYELSAVEKLGGINIILKSDMLSLETLVTSYNITLISTNKY